MWCRFTLESIDKLAKVGRTKRTAETRIKEQVPMSCFQSANQY